MWLSSLDKQQGAFIPFNSSTVFTRRRLKWNWSEVMCNWPILMSPGLAKVIPHSKCHSRSTRRRGGCAVDGELDDFLCTRWTQQFYDSSSVWTYFQAHINICPFEPVDQRSCLGRSAVDDSIIPEIHIWLGGCSVIHKGSFVFHHSFECAILVCLVFGGIKVLNHHNVTQDAGCKWL